MKKRTLIPALLISLNVIAAHANNLSLSVDGKSVLDSDTGKSWTQDGALYRNLSASLGNATLVSNILNAEAANINAAYSYTLTSADFGNGTSGGDATWWGAHAFVNYLNDISYGGLTSWALPSVGPNPVKSSNAANWAQTTSDLGHLFYNELGGVATTSGTTPLPSTTPFSNVFFSAYWDSEATTTTPTTANPNGLAAWVFGTPNGSQGTAGLLGNSGPTKLFIWAVSPVPESDSSTMVVTGLAMLGFMAARRRNSV